MDNAMVWGKARALIILGQRCRFKNRLKSIRWPGCRRIQHEFKRHLSSNG